MVKAQQSPVSLSNGRIGETPRPIHFFMFLKSITYFDDACLAAPTGRPVRVIDFFHRLQENNELERAGEPS